MPKTCETLNGLFIWAITQLSYSCYTLKRELFSLDRHSSTMYRRVLLLFAVNAIANSQIIFDQWYVKANNECKLN